MGTSQNREGSLVPPYRYDDYRNPYAASIAEILSRQGDAGARAAEQIGAANANAAMVGGNAWGRAIENIAQIPQQLQANADRRQDRELRAQEITARKSALESQTAERQQAKQQRIVSVIGSVAKGAETPDEFVSRVDDLVALGSLPKDVGDHIKTTATKSGVGGWGATRKQYIDFSAQFAKPMTLAKGGKIVNPVSGEVVADNPEPVKPMSVAPGGTLVDPTTNQPVFTAPDLRLDETVRHNTATEGIAQTTADRQKAAQDETARHNAAMEQIGRMGAGRAEAAQQETARHNRAMEENARNAKIGRPVISGDANRLADLTTAMGEADTLDQVVTDPGLVAKFEAAVVPDWVNNLTGGWANDAKAQNAVIARVRQIIGKGLEGGVLRKEDEIKYKDMLPNLGENKELVTQKIKTMKAALDRKRGDLINSLSDAGYDVSRYQARTAAPVGPEAPPAAPPPKPVATPKLKALKDRK